MPDQQPQSDLPKRFPMAISPENRGSSTAYDARLVNCYVEKSGQNDYDLFQRPGLLQNSQPSGGAATGAGSYNWLGDVYSVFGTTLYQNTTSLGTVDGTNGVYRFSSSLGGTPKLQLGNGIFAYNYDSGAGLVLINDPDFPAAFRKGWAFLDGTTYVMKATAHIQGSDINTPTSWDPLNDVLAQIEPDQGVALNKQLVYVIAFKQWTTEVFFDAANSTGSPLGAVQGAKIPWGCVSQDSVQQIGDTLLWLATNRSGAVKVARLDNLKAGIVSIKPVERLLKNLDYSTVYSFNCQLDGHSFYVVTIKNSNLTLAYDLEEKMWSQWTDASGNYFPIVSSTFDSSMNIILQHETNGKLYKASNAYADDDGTMIQVDVYTPAFDGGTHRVKSLSMLKVVSDMQAGSELMIRANDWDYDPTRWSEFRRVDLSQKDPILTNEGSFIRRAYNLRHAKRVRMPRVSALEMQIAVGSI